MHAEAYYAVERLLKDQPLPARPRALDLGACNVNGSARGLVPGVPTWVGVDLREGPGVDVVADAATYVADKPFDLILTTEMLEHAKDPAAILKRCWENLKPGGLLILTAAGPGRLPHSNDGLPELAKGEHYANITPKELAQWLDRWHDVVIEENPGAGDVYARAWKPDPKAEKAEAKAERVEAAETKADSKAEAKAEKA
jgi:SAM-dependent methyltransferase